MLEPASHAISETARLWTLERLAHRRRFEDERQRLTLDERVRRGLAWGRPTVADTEPTLGGRILVWLEPGQADLFDADDFRARNGDPVRLWWQAPDERDAVLSVIARRDERRIALMLDGDADDALERMENGGFHLEMDAPEVTFDRGDRALARLRDARPGTDDAHRGALLFGRARPRFALDAPRTPLDLALNHDQWRAVCRALQAEDIALIHGPPGTGKTRTLVEVIRQAVARGERVLASAASNTAVDNLAARLLGAGIELTRLGHPARIDPLLSSRCLETLVQKTPAYQLAKDWNAQARELRRKMRAKGGRLDRAERLELLHESRRLRRDAKRHLEAAQQVIIDRQQVVCATAAGADSFMLGGRTFDLVVLDEATQSPDPVSLVALLRGARLVMAGDPCQLPPTVIDEVAGREGLSGTFFERLAAKWPEAVTMLIVQHRMNTALMTFSSRAMYHGALVAAPEVADQLLSDLPGLSDDPLRPGPLLFVDTAGTGFSEERSEGDPSTFNPQMAARTVLEVERVLERGLSPTDLAVITPYEAQARLLRTLLADARRRGLEIGTIDGFQGREKEAIVVDLVRSNDAGDLGFLADVRRMNVALTRARRYLCVVGDSATLGSHPYYDEFLAAVERAGGWVSAWSDSGH
ncbi:MAG: AAA family ATPase [Myxococcales bacterium]|nr:AAA family ATPase [Myxococcales bacterium]